MNAAIGTHKQNSIILTVRADGQCFADYLDERHTIHARKSVGELTLEQLFARATEILRTEGVKNRKNEKHTLEFMNRTSGLSAARLTSVAA